ncbi:MAG: O-antigen ligase family protein [Actinomycetota bacterium]
MTFAAQRGILGIPLLLVPTLGVTQGGYTPDAWVWSGALAAWACAVAVVVTSNPGALRRAWPWAAASGALLLWTLLSAIWSVNAAQSVLESRRTLLYAAVVLALLLLARSDTQRLLVPATHVAITALLIYALARYLLGTRRYDEFEQYLLQQPLGYANAVGILSVLGLLLALGIVAGTAPLAARAAAAASVPVLALTLDFSHSTASDLALGAGLAVFAVLTPATLRLLAAGAVLVPAAAISAGIGSASHFASIVTTPRIPGLVVLAVAVACAGLAAAAITYVPLPVSQPPSRRLRLLLVAAVLVVALGGAAAVALSGTKEPRALYYHVAWHDEFLAHPALGTGAATFGRYWLRFGKPLDFGGALDAHSLYLETLAELGPFGLLLLLAMLLAPLRGALARRRAPYVPAAVAAYAAFLVHAGLDWDWEIPAVVVAALCCAGAVQAAELGPGRPLGRVVRGALLAVSAALGACAIAGARSNTVPAALPETTRAPRSEALVRTRV